jgi:hypothetical protein
MVLCLFRTLYPFILAIELLRPFTLFNFALAFFIALNSLRRVLYSFFCVLQFNFEQFQFLPIQIELTQKILHLMYYSFESH